jgi:hypothetical protein
MHFVGKTQMVKEHAGYTYIQEYHEISEKTQ